MNAKINKITDEDRRIIYEMWTNGYTQVEIAEALHISVGSLRNEMLKGFNGEFYVGGRKVYDPMVDRDIALDDVIRPTRYAGIDVIPANMKLLTANMQVMMDSSRPQQTRLRAALRRVDKQYDYCLIDNAPDINISIINALVASHEVVIPVKIDPYAFDGLLELKAQIDITREELNPDLHLLGCLITCFQRVDGERQGEDWLRQNLNCPVFTTHIRYSGKVVESSFSGLPISEYSRTCGAARDYSDFVAEYLHGGERS